jgi:hypothetical protein
MKKFEVEFECLVHESRLATVEAESKDEAKKTVEDGEYEDSLLVSMEERIGEIFSVEEVTR